MATKSRIYLDACCFIDMARQAVAALPTARDADVWYCKKILEAHKDGEVEVYTSTLTIAECTHADGNMTEPVRDVFSRLLSSGQFLVLVQPTPFVAADARDLRWKHGITLRGADYLHVASALSVKCNELLTTDAKMQLATQKLKPMGLRVCAPNKTGLLPDRYRQGGMFDPKVTPLRRPAKGG